MENNNIIASSCAENKLVFLFFGRNGLLAVIRYHLSDYRISSFASISVIRRGLLLFGLRLVCGSMTVRQGMPTVVETYKGNGKVDF